MRNDTIIPFILFGIILLMHLYDYDIENFDTITQPKIILLVISTNDNGHARWKAERNSWLTYFKQTPNVTAELIECRCKEDDHSIVKSYKCDENYMPGIFNKTILSIKKNIGKYNYYIRTNLSTFIIKSRLTEYLKEKKPTYGGVYCSLPDSWVGGWGIIMNDISADKLQKMAPKFKDTSNEVPDDVLIGKILKTSDITCENVDNMGYIWDYKLSFDRNIHNIDKTPTNIFIRLCTDNLSEYDVVIKNLYNIYG